jgi:hypothetical protein
MTSPDDRHDMTHLELLREYVTVARDTNTRLTKIEAMLKESGLWPWVKAQVEWLKAQWWFTFVVLAAIITGLFSVGVLSDSQRDRLEGLIPSSTPTEGVDYAPDSP